MVTESDILQSLSKQTNNGIAALTVRLDDGHLVIGGRATSYYMKQVVTQTALANAGSRRVRNEIAVHSAPASEELYG